MGRQSVLSAAILCLLVIVINRVHGSPFFFPASDCYQPTETPYTGGYDNYQGPDYQETLQEILRALQEIVYLTVRAAKEELSQLASLWAPTCDSGENGALPQAEVSDGGWLQGQSSASSSTGQSTSGSSETSSLSNEVRNETVSSVSSSSETSTSKTTKKTTVTRNTTAVTQEPTVRAASTTTPKNIGNSLTQNDLSQTPKLVTEEAAGETVASTTILMDEA